MNKMDADLCRLLERAFKLGLVTTPPTSEEDLPQDGFYVNGKVEVRCSLFTNEYWIWEPATIKSIENDII